MKLSKELKRLITLVAAAAIFGIGLGIGFGTEVFENAGGFGKSLKLSWTTFLNVVIAVAALVAINCLLQLLLEFLKKGSNRSKTMSTVISSLVRYTVVIVGFCWVLRIMGVNISTIVASLGIAALVIGFGAESLIADVVTGFFFLFENQFNVGDIIEVDGFRGTVESIEIRTTSVKDAGGNVKIINNSNLTNVINRSKQGSVAVSTIGVSYSTDLDALEKKMPKILEEIKASNPIFVGEVAYLGVEELADSAVVLKFKADVTENNIFAGRRALNKELKCAFDREGINIPFPQIDVHTK